MSEERNLVTKNFMFPKKKNISLIGVHRKSVCLLALLDRNANFIIQLPFSVTHTADSRERLV